jgi:hypothetical protein
MPLTVTGAEASVRWGYRPAATLRAWTMTKTEDGLTVSGTVEALDAFAVSQRPLTLVLPSGVTWSMLTLQMAGASCSATLGPAEGVGYEETALCGAGRGPAAD